MFLTKFWGVFIDCNLNWKEQIIHVKKKVLKSICITTIWRDSSCIMYKIRWKLNETALLTLYHTLIEPDLQYCSEIWGLANKTFVSQIVLQKRAVILICKVNKLTSTTCSFRKLKVLKFTDLVDYKIGLLMYKVKHNSLPSGMQAFFQINYVNKYFTRQIDKFCVTFARTTLKAKCVSVYGVKLWNSLDVNLRKCSSYPSSKQI